MDEQTCPQCRLLNPPSARRCDCGYDFESRSQEASYLDAPLPHKWSGRSGLILARPLVRAVGALIDLLVIASLLGLLLLVLDHFGVRLQPVLGRMAFGVFVGLTYYLVCETLTQRTLGKLIVGTRVVSMEGVPVVPGQLLTRTVMRLKVLRWIGAFWGHTGHDLSSRTEVVMDRTPGGPA